MTSEYRGRQQGWVAGACVLNFNKFGSHGEVKNVKAERTKGQPELKRKKKRKGEKKSKVLLIFFAVHRVKLRNGG